MLYRGVVERVEEPGTIGAAETEIVQRVAKPLECSGEATQPSHADEREVVAEHGAGAG